MALQTESSPARSRTRLRRREVRTSVIAGSVVVVLVALLAFLDPTGLLAPVGGHGMPVIRFGGVYQWAPLVVGLPVLLAGTVLPVYAVGRSSARAGWMFLATWIAVTGAVALAAAATGLAAALPLVGPHLSFVSALTFAVATSGFAGLKGLVAGPLVGLAAALAHGRRQTDPAGTETADLDTAGDDAAVGGRADTAAGATATTGGPAPAPAEAPSRPTVATATGLAVGIMFVVVALAAVGNTSWRGGPVGYAFAGPLLAPTTAASALGALAGTLVFLAIFGLTVRSALRRTPDEGALAVWLAAIVAGVALGVLGAVVAGATGHLDVAGPDSWWIATTLIAVATGIGYGVGVGPIAAAATALMGRGRVRVPQLRTWVVVGTAVVLLLVPLAVPTPAKGPDAVPPQKASGGMERLHLLPAREKGGLPVIGDVTGRRVILRGANVNQLIDYYLRDPAVPATQPPTDEDFAQMAAMGFNVVRLGMSWSRLEPTRGSFDEDYLDEVKNAVADAKRNGLYTVLDMHEDAWGNALARPDESCGLGTSPTTGWDGAPDWATFTDGALHCQFMARDLAPAVATAYSSFYTDRDGIQKELVRTWATVAAAFADEPAVAGYDLFNEPGIGATPPVSSGLLLGRYYDAAITAIREAESTSGGFAHLAFFEPSVLWSGLGFDVTPPPGFTSDTQLVFSPHPYSESITLDQSLGLTIASIERNLTMSAEAARSYGAALWLGEWGWFGDPDVDGAKVQRFVGAQDRLGVGGAFWVWRQGCGSPETGDDATSSGNLVSVDCATGELTPPPAGFAEPLSRAYPQAFPGRLDSLMSGGAGLTFRASVDDPDINCRLDVWVPGDASPVVSTVGVTGVETTKVDGGWRVTGCATGRYTVEVGA
ncbi:cellulase family glycosylhydrolase [Cellulomonas sp. URHD0024]|uniref:cellulase family glycosylhydrolase n=1 Tax=Cellulomonas sp. URHD0024 TaxID=1302620 RepID=UPI0006849B09|nr:cellulase family glycosylhydrolase [Cellulomonas sp. URHD0024]